FALHTLFIGAAGAVPFLAYYHLYRPEGLTPVLVMCAAVLYAAVVSFFGSYAPKLDRKNAPTVVMGLVVLAAIVYLSPAGAMVAGYADGIFSKSSLFSTIAEQQAMTPDEYTAAFGVIGTNVGGFKLLDLVMVLFLLMVAFEYTYTGAKEPVFLAIAVLPFYLLFARDLKLVGYLGLITVIALSVCLGGAVRIARMIYEGKKEELKLVNYAIAGFAVLLAAYMAFVLLADIGPFFGVTAENISGRCETLPNGHPVSQKLYCNKIPNEWIETLEWVKENTPKDATVLAWWDYGHWINYIGERKAVLRNDLARPEMIRNFANLLASDDAASMGGYMEVVKADYLAIDEGLVNKWLAISYLSCLEQGKTTKAFTNFMGQGSECESKLTFELFENANSDISNYCQSDSAEYVRVVTSRGNAYCMPKKIEISSEVFDKDMRNPMNMSFFSMSILRDDAFTRAYLLLYEKKGFGGVYDSVFYSGWYLGVIDGFEKVYSETPDAPGLPSRISVYKLA
ncbi:MAG: hypothetical protein ABIF01_00665, partial [Candidatus Micrarchaeota archaeon]